MTATELNDLKKKLFSSSISSVDSVIGKAEQILYQKLFDEIARIVTEEDGEITDPRGRLVKLSTAIEKVFDTFNKSDALKIVRDMTDSFDSIQSLNEDYFRSIADDKARFDDLISKTESRMKERIGLSSSGSLIRGGYLFNLINNDTLKNKVQQYAQRGVVNAMDFNDYINLIRTTVQGNSKIDGVLTEQMRAFAHDAFGQYSDMVGNMFAQELDLNYFIYAGGLIETSRPFCIKRNGLVFSRQEATKWIRDPDLPKTREEKNSGVINYDPLVDKGRWRCRHNINWITKALAMRLRPDLFRAAA